MIIGQDYCWKIIVDISWDKEIDVNEKKIEVFYNSAKPHMRVEKHADQHTFAQVKKIISWNDVSNCRAGRRARACKADQKPEKESRKC